MIADLGKKQHKDVLPPGKHLAAHKLNDNNIFEESSTSSENDSSSGPTKMTGLSDAGSKRIEATTDTKSKASSNAKKQKGRPLPMASKSRSGNAVKKAGNVGNQTSRALA